MIRFVKKNEKKYFSIKTHEQYHSHNFNLYNKNNNLVVCFVCM
ncbi:hypothetical protein HMPREF0023_1677 [Acinetobacter sp. ATCC 27244]|nr:hypothetical protein HMPREF0023_1677 [Acinetobacter sp. ATCC 27244]